MVVSFYRQNERNHMFLYNKRTRNVIKVVWGVFAVLIILSMIVAYGGFASLAGTGAAQPEFAPIEFTEEELALLKATSSVTIATSTVSTSTIETTPPPAPTPPVQEFDFNVQ
jgi:hypothetical protein